MAHSDTATLRPVDAIDLLGDKLHETLAALDMARCVLVAHGLDHQLGVDAITSRMNSVVKSAVMMGTYNIDELRNYVLLYDLTMPRTIL